jgi:fructoselysine and glucoselysine-specific PTS system IIB component
MDPFAKYRLHLVANDKVVKDEFQKMTLNLAKPSGIKLLIKSVADAATFLSDERSKTLKILVLVNNVKDVAALVELVPEINFD